MTANFLLVFVTIIKKNFIAVLNIDVTAFLQQKKKLTTIEIFLLLTYYKIHTRKVLIYFVF